MALEKKPGFHVCQRRKEEQCPQSVVGHHHHHSCKDADQEPGYLDKHITLAYNAVSMLAPPVCHSKLSGI